MATSAEYRKQSFEQRIARLERTPSELSSAVESYGDAALSRRPDAKNWCAKEVVCHLRDIEELFMLRFHMMLGTDEPTFLVLGELPPDPVRWGIEGEIGMPLSPDRWAEERQYRRNDTSEALSALSSRREQSLALLRKLTLPERQRGSCAFHLFVPVGLTPPAAGIRDAVHQRAAPSPPCLRSEAAHA